MWSDRKEPRPTCFPLGFRPGLRISRRGASLEVSLSFGRLFVWLRDTERLTMLRGPSSCIIGFSSAIGSSTRVELEKIPEDCRRRGAAAVDLSEEIKPLSMCSLPVDNVFLLSPGRPAPIEVERIGIFPMPIRGLFFDEGGGGAGSLSEERMLDFFPLSFG